MSKNYGFHSELSIALLLSGEEPTAAGAYGQEALALAAASAYLAGQATSYTRLGIVAGNQGLLRAALAHFEAALAIFETLADEYNIASTWNQIAVAYKKQGDHLNALAFYQKALTVFERLGKQLHLSRVLNNMATLYNTIGDHEIALPLYERTLALKQACGDQERIPYILNNLGNLYREMGNPRQALTYLEQAEALMSMADKRNLAVVLNNIAWCYTKLGEADKAEQMLLQVLPTHEALHNHEGMTRALLLLAEIALAQRQYDEARRYATQALVWAEGAETKLEMRDAHYLLAAAYAGVEDYHAAYVHHQRFHTIDHEMFNYQKGQQIAQMRSRYATEVAQKEAEIYRLQNEELHQAKEAAEEASRAKSRFLAGMSHELRTPLSVIIGYAELLQAQQPDRRGLAAIERSGRHLLTLIQDLLDIARIESGKLVLTPHVVNLPAFLAELREMMALRAADKGIAFYGDFAATLPHYLLVDQRRIRQVLINLIDNAIKFTDEGQITLRVAPMPSPAFSGERVRAAVADHCTLHFAVEDTGIGMEPAALSTIFEPFQQAGNPERNRDGIGLGLAISRQLVALMGGTLQATSAPGRGSTFFFDVTLALVKDVVAEDHFTRQIVGYEGTPVTILIVDDNAEMRRLLCDRLLPLGFTIIEAADGEAGFARALAHHPDLMLVDLVMPQVAGFDLIRWVRETPQTSEMFAIALSASTFAEDVERALAVGFDYFLPKPIDFTLLLTLIGESLGLQWTERTMATGLDQRRTVA